MLFLDTEFTDLIHPELLSIGMLSIDGAEFYAELDLSTEEGQARRQASSDYVHYGGVLDLWGKVPGSTGTLWKMGRRAGEWLLAQAVASPANRTTIAFDYSTDYELLEYAIRDAGLWDAVREVARPCNINRLTGTIVGELAAEDAYREISGRGLGRHHALGDALALRAAYLAIRKQALRGTTEAEP